jgi:hypothetical protein
MGVTVGRGVDGASLSVATSVAVAPGVAVGWGDEVTAGEEACSGVDVVSARERMVQPSSATHNAPIASSLGQ